MSQKVKYTCDICGKTIKDGHQQVYMVKVIIHSVETTNDGGITTENVTSTYHIHNDLSNHCISKIWKLFKRKRN